MRPPELDDFQATFSELCRAKAWADSKDLYRIAALILLSSDSAGLGPRLAAGVRDLRKRIAWADPLRGIAPLLVALAIVREQQPAEFYGRLVAHR